MLNKPGSSGVDALSIRAAAEAAAASCPPMRSLAAAAPSSAASSAAVAGGGEMLDTELLKDRNKAFEHFRCERRAIVFQSKNVTLDVAGGATGRTSRSNPPKCS